jgi:ubiquinone/menaquinone biosynthesis C-methylase UbiE
MNRSEEEKMDQHKWHHLSENERRKWQNPEAILKESGLKSGLTFIDIGCGAGFFTLPAARLVGPGGKVYGLDIDESGIREVRKKALREGLNNLELVTEAAEEAVLCQGCADVVFFGIVLHDFESPLKVLQNARKMIKADGLLVDLDWKKIKMEMGPPLEIRFNEDTAARLIESAGFKTESMRDSGQFHYMITARPLN